MYLFSYFMNNLQLFSLWFAHALGPSFDCQSLSTYCDALSNWCLRLFVSIEGSVFYAFKAAVAQMANMTPQFSTAGLRRTDCVTFGGYPR